MTSLLRAWLFDPVALLFLSAVLLLLAITLAWRRRRTRRRRHSGSTGSSSLPRWVIPACSLWVVLYLVSSAPLVVNPLIASLEDPYLTMPACAAGSHLVVLGGGIDSRLDDVRQFGRMHPATLSRVSEAARILEAEPGTRVIAAGGPLVNIAEADVMAAYLAQIGIEPERILREDRSVSTRENAVYVSAMLGDETIRGPVRLITSAMHMHRALSSFRQVLAGTGIEVCPVSVDVQAIKDIPFYALMPQVTAISRFDLLLHEALALLSYRLKGWL